MKILAFTDTHTSITSLREVKKKSKEADIIVCAGDLSIFDTGLDAMMFELNKIGKPILLLPGNHDSPSDVKELCKIFKHIVYLHRKVKMIGDVLFIGYGNSGFELKDMKLEKWGKKILKKYKKEMKKARKIVLVTHGPPFMTKLDKILGDHCGDEAVSWLLEKTKPDLYICGHIHENFGKSQTIGKTRLINPGPNGKKINL